VSGEVSDEYIYKTYLKDILGYSYDIARFEHYNYRFRNNGNRLCYNRQ